jgi:hypothetical protein
MNCEPVPVWGGGGGGRDEEAEVDLELLIKQVGAIQSELISALEKNEMLEKEVEALRIDLDSSNQHNKRLLDLINERQSPTAMVDSTAATNNYVKLLNQIKQANSDNNKSMKLQYELDIVIQQKRNVERDLQMLKTENQRLQLQSKRR